MSNQSTDAPWPALRRAWIERAAQDAGHIRRSDICAALGISMAQCSADLQQLLHDHPGCLTYDLRAKLYRWTGGIRLATHLPDFLSQLKA